MMICGRNTMTLPTPEITPFWRKLCRRPAGMVLWTSSPSESKPELSSSMSGCAQANTAWNITNRISASTTRPPTGCRTTASIRAVSVSGLAGRLTQSAMIRSASRWVARSSGTLSARQPFAGGSAASLAEISSVSFKRSAVPPLRTAIEVTTGTPSSPASRATSTLTPRRVAMSNMLSTRIIGRPVRLSSSSRRMVRRRLVASATHSTRSGTVSPVALPSTKSRVISSSGLRPRSE